MHWLLIPITSFLWRLRGGLMNDLTGQRNFMGMNDTVVRILYAVGVAWIFMLMFPLSIWQLGLLTAALFAGATIGWFGQDVHLDELTVKGAGVVSLSTLLRTGLISVALLSPIPLIAGLLGGPIYWLGGRLPRPPQVVPWKGWVWNELLFGAALGASLMYVHLFIFKV